MNAPFIHEHGWLSCPEARRLYHGFAEALPIIDFHSHLPAEPIARDHRFRSISELWLAVDPYKWVALRTNGVDERLITGDASDRDKFQAWAETMPYCLRNPLYHWSHLELVRYFGIHERLDGASAASIWQRANAVLATPEGTCRGLLRRSRVAVLCTTDDPVDDLAHHRAIAADPTCTTRVLPTWRPDALFHADQPPVFNAWVDRLGQAAPHAIGDAWEACWQALVARHRHFAAHGCRLADYGLETVWAEPWSAADLADGFARVRAGRALDGAALLRFRSGVLESLLRLHHQHDWAVQLHLGARRGNSTRMRREVGESSGFDSIGDGRQIAPLARLLDRLDQDRVLPRTILYNLNPADNEAFATLIGAFQGGGIPGRVQLGAAWWFLDQRDGMRRNLEALSQMSLLRRSVGMLTDSRSFLSFVRHECFRRLLCDLLGREMRDGLLPDDPDLIGALVSDVCYGNAARWFGFATTSPRSIP